MAQELASPMVRTGGRSVHATAASEALRPELCEQIIISAEFSNDIAGGASSRRNQQGFTPSFRRSSQNNADAGQISTGTNPAIAEGKGAQTSVIVLVTSSGNVTVQAN